ncbi:MAG: hypothetical protein UIM53_08205, partial [Acutalibacteraceae bacterium]|nr:hypothetical protein [Acutalibacteraceae bacterium]
ALHTASSKGDSLSVDQYSFITKSARKSFSDFKWCLVLNKKCYQVFLCKNRHKAFKLTNYYGIIKQINKRGTIV